MRKFCRDSQTRKFHRAHGIPHYTNAQLYPIYRPRVKCSLERVRVTPNNYFVMQSAQWAFVLNPRSEKLHASYTITEGNEECRDKNQLRHSMFLLKHNPIGYCDQWEWPSVGADGTRKKNDY